MLHADVRVPLRTFTLDALIDVAPGRVLALAGPSGAGKSTLVRAIAGVRTPAEGRIACGDAVWFDGAAGIDVRPEDRRCGLVPQHDALFPHLTAWRNVAYGMRGVARGERRERAHALLARFGVASLADARPTSLSGGERRRVALARALAAEPRALLLDEPLTGLDPQTRTAARAELADALAAAAVPAVLVTHDARDAAALADEVAVLEDGKVVQRGTLAALAAAPASPFTAAWTDVGDSR